MNIERIFMLLPILILCMACSQTTIYGHDVSSHPYGIWSTERGQMVVVVRDGTYIYCDRNACMTGQTEPLGVESVVLKGFVDSPVTQALRTDSEFDEGNALRGDESVEKHDLHFHNNVGTKEGHMNMCDNRPCHLIGNQETNIYRFIKIEDF